MTADKTSPAKIGIVTVSDRASAGVYKDLGGPAIHEYFTKHLANQQQPVARLVADEVELVAAALRELADTEHCCLIVTTGGTGPVVRDVTPEATEQVCEKMMPGFGELMRATSLKVVPTAILSRQTAGIKGGALIINLPGKPSSISECFDAVMPAVPYCIDLINGPSLELTNGLVAFRPKGKQFAKQFYCSSYGWPAAFGARLAPTKPATTTLLPTHEQAVEAISRVVSHQPMSHR